MRNVQSISITIPTSIAEQLNKLQKTEMKSCSAIVSEALKEHIELQQFKKIQKQLSCIAKSKKIVSEEDVDRLIHELR